MAIDSNIPLPNLLLTWLRYSYPSHTMYAGWMNRYNLRDFQAWVEQSTGEARTLEEVQEAVRFLVEFPAIKLAGHLPTKPYQTELLLYK